MKDGTTVGSIGVIASNNLYINGDTVGIGIGDDNVYPTNSSGSSTDGQLDLGDSSARFRDLLTCRFDQRFRNCYWFNSK